MKGQKQLFSHKQDDWGTPKDRFAEWHKEFRFTVDACANGDNHLLPLWWGPQSPVGVYDSLLNNWRGHRVWLNPPYSMCSEFMAKASVEMYGHDVLTVALVPSRTDTKWWHNYVYNENTGLYHPGVSVRFIKGRLKFEAPGEDENGPKVVRNSAPFPSALIIFDPQRLK